MFLLFLIYYDYHNGVFEINLRDASFTVYLKPYESIEIKLDRNVNCIFSKWKKLDGLQLEVKSIDDNGVITNYGTFNKESGLIGVHFKSVKYYLKFYNDNQKEINFAILFNKWYDLSLESPSPKYQFPNIEKLSYSENFLFEDRRSKVLMYFGILVGVIIAVNFAIIIINFTVLNEKDSS